MATTTTNFGWDIPQSTDLVKDGATAIAALGQDIDTSMVDLKGGTTGQILSKTSGTDMDFTWITPNPGDITGVTAGTGLTGGGTSGSVTLDFDVANYGGGQYAAGKNKIINGDFGIWQRGTSFTATANGTYLADRWFNTTGSSLTVTRDTDVPVNPYFTYSMKMVGTGDNSVSTRIESANSTPLAGQTVTLSFYAKRTSGTGALDVRFYYPSATDNFATVTQIGSTSVVSASPSSSWARYSATVAIGTNITTGLQILINNTGASTTFITGVQLELGSSATPFSRAGGSIQGELAACQRYYYRQNAAATYTNFGAGQGSTSTVAQIGIKLPVTMRTSPTVLDYSTLRLADESTGYAVTALAFNSVYNSPDFPYLQASVASGLTAQRYYSMGANNSTSAYIGLGAEL